VTLGTIVVGKSVGSGVGASVGGHVSHIIVKVVMLPARTLLAYTSQVESPG